MDDTRYPKNTEQTLYIQSNGGVTLDTIVDAARVHFPDCEMSDLTVTGENIQIKCFGYDLYDSQDYLDYIVISR